MSEISVIVPFFNAARTLDRCLEALMLQDEPGGGYEVIAVDNNSADGARAVASRYPAVRLLSEPRQTSYAARNRGLRAARGRLIAFTDADCVPQRDWLRRLRDAMTDPTVMVVMGRDRPAGRSRNLCLLSEYDHFKETFVMGSADPAIYYGHTNNLIARRELFEQVGFFEERPRGADVIFVHRVLRLHGTDAVRYEPRAIVEHLEIDSARVYFKKGFIYGRSARHYGGVAAARPLRNAERLLIYQQTVRFNRMSAVEAGLLLVLLVIGAGFYHLGWLSVLRAPALPAPVARDLREMQR